MFIHPDAPKFTPDQLIMTCLEPYASMDDVNRVCTMVRNARIKTLCIGPYNLFHAKTALSDCGVKLAVAVDFPFGQSRPIPLSFEVANVIDNGADEIFIVANHAAMRSAEGGMVSRSIEQAVIKAKDKPVTVIIEAGLVEPDLAIELALLAEKAGAKGVQLTTGCYPYASDLNVQELKFESYRFLLERWRQRLVMGMHIVAGGSFKMASLSDARWAVSCGATRVATTQAAAIAEKYRLSLDNEPK